MPSAEYMKEYRRKLRERDIEHLGGVCIRCGSNENLEFDHVDPKTKSFNLSNFSGPRSVFLTELDKCQLLCSICHDIKTAEDRVAEHGTSTRYLQKCRCEKCCIAMREARRAYNLKYRGRP